MWKVDIFVSWTILGSAPRGKESFLQTVTNCSHQVSITLTVISKKVIFATFLHFRFSLKHIPPFSHHSFDSANQIFCLKVCKFYPTMMITLIFFVNKLQFTITIEITTNFDLFCIYSQGDPGPRCTSGCILCFSRKT